MSDITQKISMKKFFINPSINPFHEYPSNFFYKDENNRTQSSQEKNLIIYRVQYLNFHDCQKPLLKKIKISDTTDYLDGIGSNCGIMEFFYDNTCQVVTNDITIEKLIYFLLNSYSEYNFEILTKNFNSLMAITKIYPLNTFLLSPPEKDKFNKFLYMVESKNEKMRETIVALIEDIEKKTKGEKKKIYEFYMNLIYLLSILQKQTLDMEEENFLRTFESFELKNISKKFESKIELLKLMSAEKVYFNEVYKFKTEKIKITFPSDRTKKKLRDKYIKYFIDTDLDKNLEFFLVNPFRKEIYYYLKFLNEMKKRYDIKSIVRKELYSYIFNPETKSPSVIFTQYIRGEKYITTNRLNEFLSGIKSYLKDEQKEFNSEEECSFENTEGEQLLYFYYLKSNELKTLLDGTVSSDDFEKIEIITLDSMDDTLYYNYSLIGNESFKISGLDFNKIFLDTTITDFDLNIDFLYLININFDKLKDKMDSERKKFGEESLEFLYSKNLINIIGTTNLFIARFLEKDKEYYRLILVKKTNLDYNIPFDLELPIEAISIVGIVRSIIVDPRLFAQNYKV